MVKTKNTIRIKGNFLSKSQIVYDKDSEDTISIYKISNEVFLLFGLLFCLIFLSLFCSTYKEYDYDYDYELEGNIFFDMSDSTKIFTSISYLMAIFIIYLIVSTLIYLFKNGIYDVLSVTEYKEQLQAEIMGIIALQNQENSKREKEKYEKDLAKINKLVQDIDMYCMYLNKDIKILNKYQDDFSEKYFSYMYVLFDNVKYKKSDGMLEKIELFKTINKNNVEMTHILICKIKANENNTEHMFLYPTLLLENLIQLASEILIENGIIFDKESLNKDLDNYKKLVQDLNNL